MEDEAPKIQVDDDWKREARKEKEKLAAETESQAAGASGPLPEAGFPALVNMLATQALLYLGAIPVSEDGEVMYDMDMAKYQIDTLQVIEEKTQGNLTDEEASLLKRTLYELRMRYVQGPADPAT